MDLNLQATEDFVTTAHKAGVPREQLERFITSGYIPLPWQLKFHALARECDVQGGPVKLGAGGARGPGKSHGVFAQLTLDDCHRVPGLKGLFLRQTGKAASESFEDLVNRVLFGKVFYKYTQGVLKFPRTGSRVILGGFEDERDIDKYIGIEYDVIAVEELNQLNKEKVEKLEGSLRTSKPGWRPRLYTSFNPGGLGHAFVKETFVEPWRANTETKTRFVPSTYRENPYLNPEYVDYLEGLSGDLGKAWREGDWDLFAGQFFTEWRYEKHVVKPFQIPDSWRKARSIDVSGRNGITSCHWFAVDYDGNVWVYREHYGTGKDADEHAKEIARLSEGETYAYTVIDNSAFSNVGLPETLAEVYIRNGVDNLLPCSKDRRARWDLMHQYLRWNAEAGPKIKFFETCYNAIRTIPTLIHDDKNPDDVDTDGEDHAADEIGYFLQTLRESKTPRPLNMVEKMLKQMQEEESI